MYSGNRHYMALCIAATGTILHNIWRQPALLRTLPQWLVPSAPSGFSGAIAGNRHYSAGTEKGQVAKRRALEVPTALRSKTLLNPGPGAGEKVEPH